MTNKLCIVPLKWTPFEDVAKTGGQSKVFLMNRQFNLMTNKEEKIWP